MEDARSRWLRREVGTYYASFGKPEDLCLCLSSALPFCRNSSNFAAFDDLEVIEKGHLRLLRLALFPEKNEWRRSRVQLVRIRAMRTSWLRRYTREIGSSRLGNGVQSFDGFRRCSKVDSSRATSTEPHRGANPLPRVPYELIITRGLS